MLDKMGKDTGRFKKYNTEIENPKPAHSKTRGKMKTTIDPRNCKATLNQGRFSPTITISSLNKIQHWGACGFDKCLLNLVVSCDRTASSRTIFEF
jgi:hypothetical protein